MRTPTPVHQAGPVITTVADGLRAQVIRRGVLPAHLDTSAHEGHAAACSCVPLLSGLSAHQQWVVVPRGTREECTQEEHAWQPLRHGIWRLAPWALQLQALDGRVELLLAMCGYCGAVEVRDVSFHTLAGLRASRLMPRRRSDVLGWYAGRRPAGRVYT